MTPHDLFRRIHVCFLFRRIPPELKTIIMTWKEVAELQGSRDTHRNKLCIVDAEMNILPSFLHCGLCDKLHLDLLPVWLEERYGPHRPPNALWMALRLQREGKVPPRSTSQSFTYDATKGRCCLFAVTPSFSFFSHRILPLGLDAVRGERPRLVLEGGGRTQETHDPPSKRLGPPF